LEIFSAILGIFLYLRNKKIGIVDSYCYSAIIVLSFYSLFIQFFFIAGFHSFSFLIDFGVIIFSFLQIKNYKKILFVSFKEIFQSCMRSKIISIFFITIFGYLFLQSILLPPGGKDVLGYHLPRVLMFQSEGTLFLNNFSTFRQVNFPLGYDVLSFLFLRFFSDYGLALYSFISYSVVILASYSLVQKLFNNANLNKISVLIIASQPQIVLQSTCAQNDLSTAALATVCFLSGYSFYKTLKPLHLLVLCVSILWGLSVKSYFTGFAVPFLLLFAIHIKKRYSYTELCRNMIFTYNHLISSYFFQVFCHGFP